MNVLHASQDCLRNCHQYHQQIEVHYLNIFSKGWVKFTKVAHAITSHTTHIQKIVTFRVDLDRDDSHMRILSFS
jgi:cysteine sulfinate desulfinase/cysteine desulfurase-like protein